MRINELIRQILTLGSSKVHRFMNKVQLEMVERAIAYAELDTDGEIKVHIVGDSKEFEGSSSEEKVHNRALAEFERLGIQQTEGRTGVFIMVSIDERRVELIADKAINDKVGENAWASEVNRIVQMSKRGYPALGLILSIYEIGKCLAEYFPKTHDKNELSNEVTVE